LQKSLLFEWVKKQLEQSLTLFKSLAAFSISSIFAFPLPRSLKARRVAWRAPMEGRAEKTSMKFLTGSGNMLSLYQ
jgi:hypothetical protein